MHSRAVVVGSMMLAACGDDAPREPGTQVIEVAMFPASPVRQLDLLFQMDDTMDLDAQQRFRDAIPALLAGLAVDGQPPDLHVGVVTSDLGTSGAPPLGDGGAGSCAGQGRDGALVGHPAVQGMFLADDGAGTRNYTGTLASVVGEMAAVGADGCGFEQPLAATRRALARDTGFTRPDAVLAVVLVADEDDCSISNTALVRADAPLGPLQSFRCTRYGIVCDESLDEPGTKTNCRPWAESPYVEDPDLTATFLRELKPRPEQLVVGALAGDPSPVVIEMAAVGGGAPALALAPSCSGDVAAAPAVRIASFVDSFASRGARATACAPQVAAIGLAIKRALGTACIETSRLADTSSVDGIQPACEVADVVPGEPPRSTLLPRCDADDDEARDCYALVADPSGCPETPDHARIEVRRASPASTVVGARVEVRCEAPL